MKITKYIVLLVTTLLIGCSNEDIETPSLSTSKIPDGDVLTLSAVVSGLSQTDKEKVITFTEDNQFVDGYVISSDREGNFFKEIIIQDALENPTTGLILLIDERALYQRYPLGSKVRIGLKGLTVGFKSGVATLGVLKERSIEPIDFSSIDNHIFRANGGNTLKPLELKLEEFSAEKSLLYITIEDMQFNSNLFTPTTKTLAGESTDRFDGLRPMTQCSSGIEIILCTSTFSSFKSVELPRLAGSVLGIITRDFGDDFYVLKMNSITDLSFEKESRCDPVFFDCGNDTSDFETLELLFEEDFETITNENKLEPLGWFNINVTGDEKRWEDRKVVNVDNRTLTISAFNSNLRPLEAWLITPEINLEDSINSFLKFRVRTRFNTGKALDIWISDSYTGNPVTTNWQRLPIDIPVLSSNFSTIQQDISCFNTSKIRVAFQYKGYDPVITSTYEIDDVQFFVKK